MHPWQRLFANIKLVSLNSSWDSRRQHTTEASIDDIATADILRLGNLKFLAILDEVLRQAAERRAGTVKLSDDGEFLASIDGLTLAVEVGVAVAEGVQVAAIRITATRVSVFGVCATAVTGLADKVSVFLTWVGCQRKGHAVGFPQVHLCTAGSRRAYARGLVGRRWLPAFNICLVMKA